MAIDYGMELVWGAKNAQKENGEVTEPKRGS